MTGRKYDIIDSYLTEKLSPHITEMKSKFLGNIRCWKMSSDIVIMIEDNQIKLSRNLWYELLNILSLDIDEVCMVMSRWIKNNLGIEEELTLAPCIYTRVGY